jgi:hypothetical protein
MTLFLVGMVAGIAMFVLGVIVGSASEPEHCACCGLGDEDLTCNDCGEALWDCDCMDDPS